MLLGLLILSGVFLINREPTAKDTVVQLATTAAETSLSGSLKLGVCPGARPNYPEQPACVGSSSQNIVIQIFRDKQMVAETRTNENGDYIFKIQPGTYILKVWGESASEGHTAQVQPGKNTLDITASQHTP